jgi:hypothetical protein
VYGACAALNKKGHFISADCQKTKLGFGDSLFKKKLFMLVDTSRMKQTSCPFFETFSGELTKAGQFV